MRQLGIVTDWQVNPPWNLHQYKLTFGSIEIADLERNLSETIRKYDVDSDLESLFDSVRRRYADELDANRPGRLYLLSLLLWVERHKFRHRRAQLHRVIQICKDYDQVTPEEFREELESLFKIPAETLVLQDIAAVSYTHLTLPTKA